MEQQGHVAYYDLIKGLQKSVKELSLGTFTAPNLTGPPPEVVLVFFFFLKARCPMPFQNEGIDQSSRKYS